MRTTLPLAGLLLSLSLCGCFKAKEDFAVNPDGSGKATCEMQVTLPQADKPEVASEQARQIAANLVDQSAGVTGVTAWKDVTFSGDKDGKIAFKGTAYFQDINKFKLSDEVSDGAASIQWKPAADGSVQLELAFHFASEPAPKDAPKLTEEEIKKKIADAKLVMAKDLAEQTQVLGDVQLVWTFTLPGPVEKSVNFQAVADKPNTVRLVFDGKKMIELLKAISEDEAAMRANIVAGKDPAGPPDPEVFNEKVFGTKGPITVSFKPGNKPLFDWAAESETAKKAMPIPGIESPAAK
jgi:hypothetical protein